MTDTEKRLAEIEAELRQVTEQRDRYHKESVLRWFTSPAFGTFCDLENSKVGTVLSMLEDGQISRGSACAVLAALAHGQSFEDITLPEAAESEFGLDEIPAEVCRELRAELARLKDVPAISSEIKAGDTVDHIEGWSGSYQIVERVDARLSPDDPIAFFVGGGFWRTSRLKVVA